MTAPNGPRTFGNSPDSQLRHMQYPKMPRCIRLWQKQRGSSFSLPLAKQTGGETTGKNGLFQLLQSRRSQSQKICLILYRTKKRMREEVPSDARLGV